MSAVLAPLTGAGPTDPVVAGSVLLVVLLVGVGAGRAKQRLTLLVAGIVAVAVAGYVLTSMTTSPTLDRASWWTTLYGAALPLAVAFVAGWLCGRGSWIKRLLVLAAAAILLAAFPYAEAGRATAAALLTGGAR
jgi:hypothetical protein